MANDTIITGVEFHNSTTGTGAIYFRFSLTVGEINDLEISRLRSEMVGCEGSITGSEQGDILNSGGWTIDGRGGDDVISDGQVVDGGAGNDTISGGRILRTGGEGNDWFVYSMADDSSRRWGINTITDFVQGEDTIDLSDFEVYYKRGDREWDFDWRGTRKLRGGEEDLRYRLSFDEDRNRITIIEGNTDRDK